MGSYLGVIITALDAQNCFEGCSSSPSSDANGNAGSGEAGETAGMDGDHPGTKGDVSTEKEKNSVAERERLVSAVLPAKSELVSNLFVLHFH